MEEKEEGRLYIGQEIKILQTLIHKAFSRYMVEPGDEKVGGTNGWIIGYLDNHRDVNVYQKDIEKKFGISRSAASKAVNGLVDVGLVRRERVPDDARLKKLVLTEKAEKILCEMHKTFLTLENELTRDFTEEEVQTLFSYLRRMQDNIRAYGQSKSA